MLLMFVAPPPPWRREATPYVFSLFFRASALRYFDAAAIDASRHAMLPMPLSPAICRIAAIFARART